MMDPLLELASFYSDSYQPHQTKYLSRTQNFYVYQPLREIITIQ